MAKFFLGLFTSSVIWEVVTFENCDNKGVLISIILQAILLGYYLKEVIDELKKKKEEA